MREVSMINRSHWKFSVNLIIICGEVRPGLLSSQDEGDDYNAIFPKLTAQSRFPIVTGSGSHLETPTSAKIQGEYTRRLRLKEQIQLLMIFKQAPMRPVLCQSLTGPLIERLFHRHCVTSCRSGSKRHTIDILGEIDTEIKRKYAKMVDEWRWIHGLIVHELWSGGVLLDRTTFTRLVISDAAAVLGILCPALIKVPISSLKPWD